MQLNNFHRDGYLLGPRVISDTQVEVLRNELDRVIANRNDSSRPQPVLLHNMTGKPESFIWQIVNIWRASEPFRSLIENSQITSAVGQLSQSRHLRIWHDQIQFKPAGTGGQNDWHQDIPYWPALRTDNMVTAWVALDDVDDENGCMSMVPGSHGWGNQIDYLHRFRGKPIDDLPREVNGKEVRIHRAPVRAGHVHFHHGLTWHGSHANRSQRPRRAIALHYLTDQTRHNAAGKHLMSQFIAAGDGEEITGDEITGDQITGDQITGDQSAGDMFPIVWRDR